MKLFKKLFIILAAVIVLVIGVAVIAITTFDPNDYKQNIAEKVKEQTGRDITIDGNIVMTFYPWLGIDVSGVKLSNAKGFGEAPFLNAETFKVRAKLMPLLRKELEMDTLVLHGVNLNLARNEQGVTNWDDLSKGGEKGTTEASGEMPLAALVLGGIDIQNVNILWQDNLAKTQTKISNLNVSTGELLLGEPIEIKASMNIASTNPALSSEVELAGTVAYEDSGELLKLKPFTVSAKVKGKEVPGGEAVVKLTTDLQVDTNNEVLTVNSIKLNAFETSLDAKLEVSDYQSSPVVAGSLDVKGEDLPQLVRIFEIEPLGSQLASVKNKNFAINTTFDANLDRQDININPLTMNILGNDISTNLIARNVQSETPALKGDIKASGENLPLLISLLSQMKGDSKEKVQALNKQLKTVPGAFSVESAFDLDMQAGTVDLPSLAINALGMNVKGNINGKQLQSSSPELTGSLAANGKDMPSLVRIAAAMSGDGKQDLSALSKQLKSVPAEYSVNTKFDSGDGAIKMSDLSIKALGLTSKGQLEIKKFLEDKPAIKGELTAKGPNLPLLLMIAGNMQGKDSALTDTGKKLSKIKDKQFLLTTKFDADTGAGNIALPELSFQSMGVNLNGSLNAKDVNKSGNISGNLKVSSKSPKPVLTAMGQGELAKVMQSFSVGTDINGNAKKISLKPLSLSTVVSGKDIPNSPASLTVNADTDIDLEKEVVQLNDFKADGLGLDLKGNLTAKNWSKTPELKGNINLAPFNLRQFLKSLKQSIPDTADPKVLQKLSLSTGISGTASSINLTGLKAELDDSKLQGDIKLASFSPLNLEFGLGLDQLNLDRYLPPKQETKAATPETVAAGAATKIPTDTLRAVTIKGDFVMGKLVVSNATLTDMELSIRAKEGDIKMAPIKAKLYQGTYEGSINLNATGKEPKLITNTKLLGVQTGPLVKDVAQNEDISGEANITLSLNSSGSDTDKLKQRLSGKGELKFLQGIFKGIDVNKVLSQVEIMYESKRFGKVDTSGETRFKSLTATMDIKNGVVKNKDMLMLGYGFKVKGEGMMVNLNDETWKYNMNVIVDSASATKGEERYNIGGYDILVKCRGKIMDKKCLPDLGSMINALIKDTAKKKITDKLGDAIGIDLDKLTGGSKKQPAEQQPIQDTQQKEPTQQETKKKQITPEDLLKEGLKELLPF